MLKLALKKLQEHSHYFLTKPQKEGLLKMIDKLLPNHNISGEILKTHDIPQ